MSRDDPADAKPEPSNADLADAIGSLRRLVVEQTAGFTAGQSRIETAVQRIRADVAQVRAEVAGLDGRLAMTDASIAQVRAEVAAMRSEIAELLILAHTHPDEGNPA